MNRIELKTMAKEQIKGNIGVLFVAYLIIIAISSVASFTVVGSLLVAMPLELGMMMIYVGMTYGDKPDLNRLIDGFKNGNFVKSVIGGLLVGVFTWLWSLLLIVPGIVKGISYSMTFYIMAEHPEMTASECIKESQRITYGHKMDLFILGLSFIPWLLTGCFTFCLSYIYVIPYMESTFANAYRQLAYDAAKEHEEAAADVTGKLQ